MKRIGVFSFNAKEDHIVVEIIYIVFDDVFNVSALWSNHNLNNSSRLIVSLPTA